MKLEQLEKQLAHSLQRSPRLNGRDEFIRSVVMVLLQPSGEDFRLILQKRHPDIRQGDEICFPGGRIDKVLDHSLEETALRETEEEMGISRRHIRVLGQLDYVIAPTGNLVDAWVGIVDLPPEMPLRPNPAEVTAVLTPGLDWFRDNPPEIYHVQLQASSVISNADGTHRVLFPAVELGLPDRYHGTWRGARVPVLVYRLDGEVVWGMTARIIHDLVKRVYGVSGSGSTEPDV